MKVYHWKHSSMVERDGVVANMHVHMTSPGQDDQWKNVSLGCEYARRDDWRTWSA